MYSTHYSHDDDVIVPFVSFPLFLFQDGIPELMKWKQFKSPFLSSCEERLDLVSSWRPVLNDPFLNDLLPLMPHPHQLTGPQDGDPFDNRYDSTGRITIYGMVYIFTVL